MVAERLARVAAFPKTLCSYGRLSAKKKYSASLAVETPGSEKQGTSYIAMGNVRRNCLSTISWKVFWYSGLLETSLKPNVPGAGLSKQAFLLTKHILVKNVKRQSTFQRSAPDSSKNGTTKDDQSIENYGDATIVNIQHA